MRPAGTTTQRGYGASHQRLRRQWAARVKAGGVCCCLCGRQILPWEPWALDHDFDRTRYRGVAHRYCNSTEPHRRRKRRPSTHWRNPAWA